MNLFSPIQSLLFSIAITRHQILFFESCCAALWVVCSLIVWLANEFIVCFSESVSSTYGSYWRCVNHVLLSQEEINYIHPLIFFCLSSRGSWGQLSFFWSHPRAFSSTFTCSSISSPCFFYWWHRTERLGCLSLIMSGIMNPFCLSSGFLISDTFTFF